MNKHIIPILISVLTLMLATSSIPVAAVSITETFLIVDVNYRSQSELVYLTKGYDVWQVDPQQQTVRLMIDQTQYRLLAGHGYQISIAAEETRLVNQPLQALPGQLEGIDGYPCYRTVEETYLAAEALAAAHPDLARWEKIGESWEKTTPGGAIGYDLKVLVLSNQTILQEKPKILISSGIHARELAPVELNTRLAEYLLANYGQDADITWLLDYHEIHLLLIANPDGRKQAEIGPSMWRKNTNGNYCGLTSSNRGADLNRNFPFHWGDAGTNPCDYNYQGPAALSEPESQALKAYELALFPDQRGPNDNDPAPDNTTGIFIDLHSYGELVLWPYGFDFTSTAPNHTQLQTLGRKLAYFNDYSPKQASALYPATGATDDDAYGTLGIAAYTIEMGTTFFQDCTTFENFIYPDNLQTLLYAAKLARTPYQTPAGPDAISLSVPGGQLAFNQPFELSAIISDTRYKSDGSTEPTQIIQAARFSIDTPPWDEDALLLPLVATDGLFEEKVEPVSAMVLPIGLSGGRHTLYVQGQDANGNWGAVSAVFFDLSYGIYLPMMAR